MTAVRIQRKENPDRMCDASISCRGRGHESKDGNSESLGRKCFVCNKFGHVANECTEKKNGKSNEVRKSADVNFLMIKMNSKFHKKYEIGSLTVKRYVDLDSIVTFVQENVYKQIGEPKLRLTEISLIGMYHNQVRPLGYFQEVVKLYAEDINDITAQTRVYRTRPSCNF